MKWIASTIFAALLFSGSPAQSADPSAREVVHLLDYIAQDYAGAVADGTVISADEFAEMREFSRSAIQIGSEVPELAADAKIGTELRALADLIEQRAPVPVVARQAHSIKAQIID